MTLWEKEKEKEDPCYCNTDDPLKKRDRIIHLHQNKLQPQNICYMRYKTIQKNNHMLGEFVAVKK